MGIVYEGRDPNLDRHVAIKTVKVENLSEEAATEYESRFRTEARSAARLQHPNIVSVYDSDRDGDIAFLVMEYIQGDDLKHHLDKGVRYSLEQSLKMIRDLLSALDYAHKQGIVHRDIKPANLLIEPGGRVKLTDFGVARMQDSGDATRTQGNMVGTLKYMSPEQVQGQKIDARADLFSVGVVLYQLLTDKRPFDGENDFSIIHQVIGHTPPPPSSINARLPAAIDAVVARALSKDRDQRFANARDFAIALQSAMRRAEDATVVPPPDPSRKTAAGASTPGVRSMTEGSPTSGSTVTQELELVYWKDIRDSDDPADLQGFLVRFPAGIYADLARRRLRKLSSGVPFDNTLDTGVASGEDDDLEATRRTVSPTGTGALPVPPPAPDPVRPPATAVAPALARAVPQDDIMTGASPPTAPAPALTAATVPTPAPPPETHPEFSSTVFEADDFDSPSPPLDDDKAAAPAVEAPGALASEAVPDVTAPSAASARRKRPVAVMAGVAAVAVAGIAALLMMGKDGGEGPLPSPMSAASATVAAEPASAPSGLPESSALATAVAASAALPVAAASAVSHRGASAARRPTASAKARVVAPAAPERERTAPMVAAAVRAGPQEARPAAVAAVSASRANPADACKDKLFLSKEFCLAEQCEKPGARNHPLCVQRREDARLREESKVRN
jgi:eukaryotic-like serine/threonine-protein kinase